jgi:hypothetical protein
LQAHLDQVRQQIQEPTSKIIDARYWITCPDSFFERPWVGVTFIRNETVLVAALADRLVILPPADRKNAYSLLDEKFEKLTSQYHRLRFFDGHRFGPPTGLIYRDRVLISPDILLKEGRGAYILHPLGDEFKPRVLYPTTKEDIEARQAQSRSVHSLHIEVKGRLEMILPRFG